MHGLVIGIARALKEPRDEERGIPRCLQPVVDTVIETISLL